MHSVESKSTWGSSSGQGVKGSGEVEPAIFSLEECSQRQSTRSPEKKAHSGVSSSILLGEEPTASSLDVLDVSSSTEARTRLLVESQHLDPSPGEGVKTEGLTQCARAHSDGQADDRYRP